MENRTLVLFDFDGTITTHDTLFLFAKFVAGKFKYWIGIILLFPWLVALRLGLVSAQRAKEIFLSYFLKGISTTIFDELCTEFCDQVLVHVIRQKAELAIKKYIQEDARIVIVSASPEDWILPWATQYNMEVIATRLQKIDNKITGQIEGINCNGPEKVNRIRERITVSEYSDIIAYGDSKGDLEMLDLATQKYFKPFQDKS